MQENITQILKNLPKSPGIYQFFNASGEIIYIGKSIHLKNRVSSYFNGKSKLNFAKKMMVEQIDDIKIILTNNETESLLLESTLIKDKKPKYNVLLRDEKNYLYIKITQEKFPKILRTRQKTSSGIYFWPYTNGYYVFNILRLAKKIFWYGCYGIHFFRDKNEYNLDKYIFQNQTTPEKDGVILSESDIQQIYREKIGGIQAFLRGDIGEVMQKLEEKMKREAKNLEFEQAAKTRDDRESLKILQENQIVRDFVSGDFDIVNIIEKYEKTYVWCIEIRDSRIIGFFNYESEYHLEETQEEILQSFVEQRFAENYEKRKPIFILPYALKNLSSEIRSEIPKIGGKLDMLKLCYKNIYEYAHKKHIDSLSTKGFTKKTMLNILTLLGYEAKNKDIVFECNDISHLSGNHTVASRSIIENGKKNPAKYRKFTVKGLEEQKIDDFASMREIIERRLKELLKLKNLPDLIVIDGGKGQLGAVMEILESFKNTLLPVIPAYAGISQGEEDRFLHTQEWLNLINSIQLVSLAKREEELFLPWASDSILLKKDSDELRLIQALRDEAHRFAITFNRDKRKTAQKKNILESLPWVGPVTRKKILKSFGSVENLKNQKKEELETLLGKKVYEILDDHGLI
jgi:excinuclease ABC subunit C